MRTIAVILVHLRHLCRARRRAPEPSEVTIIVAQVADGLAQLTNTYSMKVSPPENSRRWNDGMVAEILRISSRVRSPW